MKHYQQKFKATREFLDDVPDAENILIRRCIHEMIDKMDMDDIMEMFEVSIIGYDVPISEDQPHWMQEALFQMWGEQSKEYTVTVKQQAKDAITTSDYLKQLGSLEDFNGID